MMKKNTLIFAFVVVGICFPKIAYLAESKNKTGESEKAVYVFPVETEKQPFKPVKRVLTGIFTDKQQKKALAEDKAKAEKNAELKKKEIAPRKLNAKTIAWITPMGFYYHDPLNNCLKVEQPIWVEDKKELLGLEPCPDCFKKRNIIPAFIKEEAGNFDIAKADALLINSEFIDWVKERLPIRDMSFISGSKALISSKNEMAKIGLYNLALETQNAYLRQTWRVIEVQARMEDDKPLYLSSFDKEAIQVVGQQ